MSQWHEDSPLPASLPQCDIQSSQTANHHGLVNKEKKQPLSTLLELALDPTTAILLILLAFRKTHRALVWT